MGDDDAVEKGYRWLEAALILIQTKVNERLEELSSGSPDIDRRWISVEVDDSADVVVGQESLGASLLLHCGARTIKNASLRNVYRTSLQCFCVSLIVHTPEMIARRKQADEEWHARIKESLRGEHEAIDAG